MSEMGKAMMGTGEASGENRAANAAEAAINNPLLDETNMNGAQAVLINITGGTDMTLFEVDEAANHIRREVDSEANIIIGSAIDDKMDGIMRVSVVATGMEAGQMSQRPSTPMASTMAAPVTQPAPMAAPVAAQPVIKPVTQPEIMPEPVMAEEHIEEASVFAAEADVEIDELQSEAMESHHIHEDHDDGQQHLEDLVAEVEAQDHVEAEAEDQVDMPEVAETEEDTSSVEAAEETAEKDPFIMREVVDIPEEPVKDEAPKGLIGKISGLMFASKPVKEVEAKEADAPRADSVDLMGGPVLMSTPQAEDVKSEEQPEMHAEATAPAEEVKTEDNAPMGGLASLKPTDQPKLDMARAGEDVDLDIPAFLRRQAN